MNRFILLFFLLIGACSPLKPLSTLRIAFNAFPSTVDPRKTGDFVSSTLICLIYDGLTRCLPDGSVEPAIADRIEVSSDQTLYTFHLRPSIWSDGKPVTAYDFESSWKKIIDPQFPSLCTYLFYPIKNAEAAAKGEKALSEVGIHAINKQTLQVELQQPCPYFLSLTAFPSFLPIPFNLAEQDLDQLDSIVGNGPFRIEQMTINSNIYLVKNENFWNRDQIQLDAIYIHILFDETTALQMFERNELDWLGGPFSPLPLDAFEDVQKKENLSIFPMAATTFCSFNTNFFPLNCTKLRKALSLAINRVEIAEKITQMGNSTATRCIPPTLMGGKDKILYPAYDPAKARILLQEALQELQFQTIPPLKLSFRNRTIEKQVAQALQKQWQETLGLKIQLLEMEVKTHQTHLHNRTYEIALCNWIAQYSDPINILERFREKDNPKNYPAWESISFIQLLEQATAAKFPEARLQCLEKAEALLAQEMPLSPIYHWGNLSLSSKRLKNMQITPNGGVLFERCWISEEF
jgi:oligopeptide transport system substrate-binding protein